MSAYVFTKILERGERQGIIPSLEKSSLDWFRKEATKASTRPQQLLRADQGRLVTLPKLGHMYLFAYDPKHKATLPYYDRFPLIIPFDSVRTSGKAGNAQGFMGLNLHYLPYQLRARLMDAMYNHLNNKNLDESTQFRVSYRMLKSISQLKYFKPCVKQYLFSHMRSRFFQIPPESWQTAVFLPLDRFVKSSRSTVWKDSRNAI